MSEGGILFRVRGGEERKREKDGHRQHRAQAAAAGGEEGGGGEGGESEGAIQSLPIDLQGREGGQSDVDLLSDELQQAVLLEADGAAGHVLLHSVIPRRGPGVADSRASAWKPAGEALREGGVCAVDECVVALVCLFVILQFHSS